MKLPRRILLAITTLLILAIVYIASASAEPQLIGVYSDSLSLFPVTSLNWGTLMPGTSVTRTVYIRNQATMPMDSLSFSTKNYKPYLAQAYLSLEATPSTSTLNRNQAAKVNLTLTASPLIKFVNDFSFDVVVTATLADNGGGGGGGGSNPSPSPTATATIPPEPKGLSSTQTFIIVFALAIGTYIIVGGGHKR